MSPLPISSINSIVSSESSVAKTINPENETSEGRVQSIFIDIPKQEPTNEPSSINSLAHSIAEQRIEDSPIPQIVNPKEMDSITSLANTEEQTVRDKIEAAHNGSQ